MHTHYVMTCWPWAGQTAWALTAAPPQTAEHVQCTQAAAGGSLPSRGLSDRAFVITETWSERACVGFWTGARHLTFLVTKCDVMPWEHNYHASGSRRQVYRRYERGIFFTSYNLANYQMDVVLRLAPRGTLFSLRAQESWCW